MLIYFAQSLELPNYMQTSYNGIPVPANGKPIEYAGGNYTVPDNPIIPFIEGDGTGRDIWKASQRVFDAAVEKVYGGKRKWRGTRCWPARKPIASPRTGCPTIP